MTTFSLDGVSVTAHAGETILQAAHRNGIEIPHLCYKDGMAAAGNCRACVVEIEGERALAPSCCRAPREGMNVKANSPRATHSQRVVLELLKANVSDEQRSLHSELEHWAEKLGVPQSRFATKKVDAPTDSSHPAILVNMDACIHCTRCVRACRDEQVNDVIGMARRGAESQIVFDLGDPMGESSCVGCGECVQACPTGALMPAKHTLVEPDRSVNSVCPYCGVGCLVKFDIKDNMIIRVTGRDGPANHGRLCVKGRFGFDYVHHAERLTVPLIRKAGVPKTLDGFDPSKPLDYFREATWQEALDFAADGLLNIKQQHGKQALAGFGSAKGSNEEAYLFQKLIRLAFENNNVDHCTRMCHATSVAALLEGIGSAAVSNPIENVVDAEVIIVIGSNTTANHPVAATFIKNAAKAGKTLIVMDPRRIDLARHARYFLQFKPDTDVAMLNAMLHVIIEEELFDPDFVKYRTLDFYKLTESVAPYTPEYVEQICGVPAEALREVARVYARSKASIIFWGMGVSQHTHGTDNARCLIALALTTGQIGRAGTGLHPLRGQNNVQGASDAGLIPMMLPDYRRVTNSAARAQIEALWQASINPMTGLTAVEIINSAHKGVIRGMYIMGENPAMSDPNLNHTRAGLARLEHLVVQDIFLTETAAFADVVLPATAFPEKNGTVTNTDRRVQMGRKAIEPPGDAREDLWILLQLAQRLGMRWDYGQDMTLPALPIEVVSRVYEEMRLAIPSIHGISWRSLELHDTHIYPKRSEDADSEPIMFRQNFATTHGKAHVVPTHYRHAIEMPDPDYPFVFITGRQLEHWHTGAMTRRATTLDAIEPEPTISIHPLDLVELGAHAGDWITIESRRGQVRARSREDAGLQRGEIFMAFAYHEAAANLLTIDALDPLGKIPEFKFCAVRVSKS
jgi:formate dehydrogenase major subunit